MSCACDGTANVFQALPDAAYHVAGTTSPQEDATNACQQAVAMLRAQGLDPCDPANDGALQAAYQNALTQIENIVSTEPLSNPLQKATDVLLGTSDSSATVVPGGYGAKQPPATNSNIAYIIGAIIILAIGFFLIF
jgi:hypothetical protein